MLKLLAIGEVMAEIRSQKAEGNASSYAINFAGDTFNTAVYCARALGTKGDVSFLTRIGSDPLSAGMTSFAQSEGLDTNHIAVDPNRNIGIYSVTTDALGERSFHYWRSQSAARRLFTSEENALFVPSAQIIYVSGISLAILTPDARARLLALLADRQKTDGCLIAFDSNYRPALWENQETAQSVMSAMWEQTDIALPSIDDEMALFNDKNEADVIARFAILPCKHIAIKRGVRGPVSPHLNNTKHLEFLPAPVVVDTTAAGDSFNGGYLAALLNGENDAACMLAGHLCASRVVGAPGAIMPRD